MTAFKAIALDVDGVLTGAGIRRGPDGQEWKRFCFADIMGVSLARKAGIMIAFISGEDSPVVDRFAKEIGVVHVEKNCKDKASALQRFAEAAAVPLSQVCFMGDDVNDLAAMQLAGLAAAPANAQPAIRECAAFVASNNGGDGAVRELVDALISARRGQPDVLPI